MLLIHKRSAEQREKSPLKSGEISHTNLQVLTRQPYTLHLHIDEEKVKTTNQLQKNKLFKVLILKEVNKSGDGIHMYR